MSYHRLTSGERHEISALRKAGFKQAAIARALNRHPSTISREVRRNARQKTWYHPVDADDIARTRRKASRRNHRVSPHDWSLVCAHLERLWSPEQIVGRLRRQGRLRISYDTIYRHIWENQRRGGSLYLFLRGAQKKRRKRNGSYDSRGRLAGKRSITERPLSAENRSRTGHLEGDTVLGSSDPHCVLTLVDRKTGYLLMGKLPNRTVKATNRRAISLIRKAPRHTLSITLDNGTEFHGYKAIEAATRATIHFAAPHHSWERGTSENTNGLIRQYLPKRRSMAQVRQRDCAWIANELNDRPRKRLDYLTPKECYERANKKE